MIRAFAAAVGLALGAVALPVVASDAPDPAPAVATALAPLREQRTVELTTTGRRTGRPHTVTVWFVVDGSTVYLNTLDPSRDWVRNARKTPLVRLDFGDTVLEGELHTVTDPARAATITKALRDKYWVAWVGGLVGAGPKQTFVVDGLRPAGS